MASHSLRLFQFRLEIHRINPRYRRAVKKANPGPIEMRVTLEDLLTRAETIPRNPQMFDVFSGSSANVTYLIK
jgi:hypothetical protein